jgi:hypothetical protein
MCPHPILRGGAVTLSLLRPPRAALVPIFSVVELVPPALSNRGSKAMNKRNAKIIHLSSGAIKQRDYERFLDHDLPILELDADLDLCFFSPGEKSLAELRAMERKAMAGLELLFSKLPTQAHRERMIRKCLPWWRVVRALQKSIYDLAVQSLKEQGIEVPTKKQGTA